MIPKTHARNRFRILAVALLGAMTAACASDSGPKEVGGTLVGAGAGALIGNAIGGAAGNRKAAAQEALREENLSKDLELKGELGASADQKNRAEELKKSLGLPNDIDKEKALATRWRNLRC